MLEMMTFPDTWEEFEEQYGITDREQIYTNGARLIPSFRVKQWLDHIAPSIDIVRCKECRHRTYCYGDVLWTNKRQTVDIHKTVDFCSFGEREGE